MLVGDVIGRSGRRAFCKITPRLRKEKDIDVVIVNGENSAGGKGFTRKSLDELYRGGADIVTSGNHVWDKRDVLEFIDQEPFLIRPANYPGDAPGKGWDRYPFKAKNIGVMNLSGRAFMPPLDDPFQKVEELLREMRDECDIVFLDFHAETTSEKTAMGYYLDGRVNGVVGTHTHVQTADERILPHGTAYITDLGMVGPRDSVLGVKTDLILERFTTAMPVRFDVADGPCVYSAVIVTIDDATNETRAIERLLLQEDEL
ncbi:MAG TPA: TIGR00282 family metallophosphoesterase [Mitsuokella multacida]|nr:TIGR00282 family metallophosphoesterase [Mitsuokella multacida]